METSISLPTVTGNLVFQRKHEVVRSIKSRHRDITKDEEKEERNLQIGLAAGAVIMLIATIIATYYASKATALENVWQTDYSKVIGWHHGRPIYDSVCVGTKIVSISAIASIPGVILGGGTIAFGVGAACVNFEKNRSYRNFSKPGAFEKQMTHLTQDNIDQASARYEQGSLATGPLVDQGIITKDQAHQIEVSLRSYKQQMTLKTQWESRSDTLKKAVKEHPERYPEYQKIVDAVQAAKEQWRSVQTFIIADYTQG